VQTYEDSFIEECGALTSQLSLPPVDEGLFGDTGYSLSLFSQNFPVKYVFCERPSHSYTPAGGTRAGGAMGTLFPLPSGLSVSHHRKDVVRQIALGQEPCDSTRVCLRCGCHSLLSSLSKAPAVKAWELSVKAWELRFERACVCGGQWKLERVDKQF